VEIDGLVGAAAEAAEEGAAGGAAKGAGLGDADGDGVENTLGNGENIGGFVPLAAAA
tara:strand:- start:361 stop:531 length:171 start_codon:yes stop_codon:yes gene_type:complete